MFKKTGKELEHENKNDRFNDDRRVRKGDTRKRGLLGLSPVFAASYLRLRGRLSFSLDEFSPL